MLKGSYVKEGNLMKYDPVTTAILKEMADKLNDIGAPLPFKYKCEHEIDHQDYLLEFKITTIIDLDDIEFVDVEPDEPL